MTSVGGTASTGGDSVLGSVGGWFDGGLGAIADIYKTWTANDLAKVQVKAASGAYTPVSTAPVSNSYIGSTTGPFAGIDMRLLLLIGGAAVVALVMLKK
tara:strand:- start:5400 stop:5696 length:297 start_codon:yes stop_codon:yes gene_type:complete